MQRLFSTDDVHPRDRFDFWHSVACRQLVQHDSIPESRTAFRAEMESGSLGRLGLVQFENSAMTVRRTERQCRDQSSDELYLCRLIAGRLAIEQAGRNGILEPGDMMLLDPALPYMARFGQQTRFLVIKVPRPLLEARSGRTEELVGRSMPAASPEARLTSTFLTTLIATAAEMDPSVVELATNQTLDLLALCLSRAAGSSRASRQRSIALMKVRSVIESRLTDHTLNSAAVADAIGLSARYLNLLLAEEGLSVMRLVQKRRLARCRAALEDPAQDHRTISDIALSWGFTDTTHFGRRFRSAYGMTPGECRGRGSLARLADRNAESAAKAP